MIRSLFALILCCAALSAEEGRRIYIDAVADLMHPGHIVLFKRAKELGGTLVVGIHSDETVATYKRTPIMTMEERMFVVAACRYVDEVIPDAPLLLTEEYLQQHQIDLVVHGDDISDATCQKWYGVPMRLGKFQLFPYTSGISTTQLIQRVLDSYGK
jgi:cytidyltransferase-like protein